MDSQDDQIKVLAAQIAAMQEKQAQDLASVLQALGKVAAAKEGAAKDGAAKEGSVKEEVVEEEAAKEGVAQEGAAGNAEPHAVLDPEIAAEADEFSDTMSSSSATSNSTGLSFDPESLTQFRGIARAYEEQIEGLKASLKERDATQLRMMKDFENVTNESDKAKEECKQAKEECKQAKEMECKFKEERDNFEAELQTAREALRFAVEERNTAEQHNKILQDTVHRQQAANDQLEASITDLEIRAALAHTKALASDANARVSSQFARIAAGQQGVGLAVHHFEGHITRVQDVADATLLHAAAGAREGNGASPFGLPGTGGTPVLEGQGPYAARGGSSKKLLHTGVNR